MKKILSLMVICLLAISCSNRDDAPAIPKFDENAAHNMDILQLSEIYKMIGAKEGEYKKKLDAQGVTVNEKYYGNWNSYIATNPISPFKKYMVTFIENNRNVDYSTAPPKRYIGTNWIRIYPQNEDGTDAKESDYKKVFDYFYPRMNALDPTHKPYQFEIYNDDGYSEKLPDYDSFIREMNNPKKNVSGIIRWNNNPKPSVENSSAEKNTPTMKLEYTKSEEEPVYKIEIQTNIPWNL